MTVQRSRRSLFAKPRIAPQPVPLRPPWSREASILAACTGCGDCAPVCPSNLIFRDQDNYAIIDPGRGECSFCGVCAEACTQSVFDRALRPFTQTALVGEACLPNRGIHCQSCGDHCPEAAIRFRPRIGKPPAAEIDPAACTACLACVSACPASAITLVASARPENAYG